MKRKLRVFLSILVFVFFVNENNSAEFNGFEDLIIFDPLSKMLSSI